jgi:choline-sulfatase
MVSLQQPHFPLLAPQELFEKYLPKVPVFEDTGPSGHPSLDEGRLGPGGGLSDSDFRRATAAYAAMVEQTDTRFAQVLSTLREVGQDPDDWLIVFCADHGDMLGEHGLWGKRKFYEGSVRVPLFVRGPGVPPSSIPRNVNLVDIFPTLCQLTGLPTPAGLDGRDLFDANSDDTTFSQLGADQWMIKRGPWKLMIFPDADDVLFQLEDDPEEKINRLADPDCQDLVQELRATRVARLDSGSRP